jgi:glycosyltransferase involved in cell wall biosynthesis
MKIALVDPDLSPRTGSRRFIYEITPRLQNLGHEVTIFTTKLDKQICFKEYLSLPVEVVGSQSSGTLRQAFPNRKRNLLFDSGRNFAGYFATAFRALDISKRVADEGFQVLFLQYHGEHWLLPWFYHLKETAGVASMCVVPPISAGDVWTEARILNGLLKLPPVGIWEKQSFRKLTLFHTKSKYTLSRVKKLGIIGSKRTAIVPSGVNHSEFFPTGEEEPFALCLGRVDPEKSLELTIRAMEKTDRKFSLVIAGDLDARHPEYKEKLERLAKKVKISDRFRIIPSPSDSEGVRLMQRCSVFLFPSTIDTFGLVVLEAMACGKPMVACNRGGVPEIVGDAGFLLEPNAEEWQGTVNRLLSDSKFRKQMGEKAFERSKFFSWENTAIRLVNAFKSLDQLHADERVSASQRKSF